MTDGYFRGAVSQRRASKYGRLQKFFQGGGKVDILLILFRFLTMQRKRPYTNALPLLHHKENAQCYGNACKQCSL